MISIIVPVYKVEKYLSNCVSSILAQTYKDIEVLLIDDGSPDGSGAVCDAFAAEDPRVRVIHKENGGVSTARNAGLDNVRGEYIGFVDSDDWIEPDMYQLLLDDLLAADADISVCGLIYESPDEHRPNKKIVDKVYTTDEAVEGLVYRTITNFTWNKLYKKELFDGIRFPEGQSYEDVATLYKVVMRAERVVSSSRLMYHYRKWGGSIMSTPSMNNLVSCFRSYRDRYDVLVKMPQFQKPKLIYKMKRQIADAIGKTWRWALNVPKEERRMEVLEEMSAFVRENYPRFGDSRWPKSLRVSIFLARSTAAPNLFAARAMTKVYRSLFIKDHDDN